MRSKCDCAHRRVKKNPPDAEIAPRRTDFFVYAERNSGERGTRVRRCAEGDCGRRRHQKRTPFTKTNAGSIEAVRLVEVRRHRVAKCHRGVGPAVRCQWENRQSWPGSHVFLVGKKCDLVLVAETQNPRQRFDHRKHGRPSRSSPRCNGGDAQAADGELTVLRTCRLSILLPGRP